MSKSSYRAILMRTLLVLFFTAIALTLRWRAVQMLPVDYDEDDYLRAGQEFAQLIRTKDWSGFLETNYRIEHPPLAKILYGFSLLSVPEAALIQDKPTTAPPDQTLPKDLILMERLVGAIDER